MYNSCCNILGISPGASQTEIKHAFREKAKLYHPDLNHSPYASQEFIKVKKAFDYLSSYNPQRTSCYSKPFTHRTYQRRPYHKAQNFDYERYRKWQEHVRNFTSNHRNEFDFRTTLFGKIIYYFFHILFIFLGIYILIGPTLSVITDGIEPGRSVVATISAVIGVSAFGVIMIVVLTFSVLSKRILKSI